MWTTWVTAVALGLVMHLRRRTARGAEPLLPPGPAAGVLTTTAQIGDLSASR